MKKIIYGIVLFVFIFMLIDRKVSAFDWATEDIKYMENEEVKTLNKNVLSGYRNTDDSNKTIKELCVYESDDREDGNTHWTKYLFIYTDGTASMGWRFNMGDCERKATNRQCVDGYKKNNQVYRGIRNWSKNPNGVDNRVTDVYDAYNEYQKEKKCPTYIYQVVDGKSHHFYAYYTSDTSSKIKSKAHSGSKKYLLYNVGESDNIKQDMSCQYSTARNSESGLVELTFAKDGYIRKKFLSESNIEIEVPVSDAGIINKVKYTISGDNIYINHRLYSTAYYDHMTDGKCPKSLDACQYTYVTGAVFGSASADIKFVLYGDASPATDSYCDGNNSAIMQFYCVGDNCSDDSICESLEDLKDKLDEILKGYKNASESDKKKIINEYNTKKDELNSFCLSTLSHLNYSEGGCIESCLDLEKYYAGLEVDYGLRSNNIDQKCGVGIAIVSMLYNVLKWAKYILPALVIVLTMLDFIKAIASQNDDDMKKAQGKFVKRLIIAALLFLLPLIINFVLQTFGMYDSSCDITDLF